MSERLRRTLAPLLAALVLLSLGACSTTDPAKPGTVGVLKKGEHPGDPMEGLNRAIFGFNTVADTILTKPVAHVYRTVTPEVIRVVINNVFSNVNDVWVGVNSMLQGKPKDAFSDWGRVLVNTTFGLAGVADLASDIGLERHNEDFGQTLGKWGMPPGPYVVIPLLGPSNFRDGLSIVPDALGDPIRKLKKSGDRDRSRLVRLLDTRAGLLDVEKLADSAAIDRYDLVRDAYLARRNRLVYDGDPPEDTLSEESSNK
jgi:phospholipid-binding lipoprotein MlaA